MSKEINSSVLKSNMDFAIERIEESQNLLEKGAKEEDFQSLYFGLFEDAIAVAGYRAFFGETDDIPKHLKIAAHAVIILFQYHGKTQSTFIVLPRFTKKSVIDYSVTNPWVFVRGVYAAAITREINIVKDLVSIPIEILLKGQEPLPKDLMRFLKFLPSIIHKPFVFEPPTEESFWSIQTNTLKSILEGGDEEISEAFVRLKSFLSRYYSEEKYLNKPERFYSLPLHGLSSINEIKKLL